MPTACGVIHHNDHDSPLLEPQTVKDALFSSRPASPTTFTPLSARTRAARFFFSFSAFLWASCVVRAAPWQKGRNGAGRACNAFSTSSSNN